MARRTVSDEEEFVEAVKEALPLAAIPRDERRYFVRNPGRLRAALVGALVGGGPTLPTPRLLKDAVAAAEAATIRAALARHNGARAVTAVELGISRKNLWEKMRDYGIE